MQYKHTTFQVNCWGNFLATFGKIWLLFISTCGHTRSHSAWTTWELHGFINWLLICWFLGDFLLKPSCHTASDRDWEVAGKRRHCLNQRLPLPRLGPGRFGRLRQSGGLGRTADEQHLVAIFRQRSSLHRLAEKSGSSRFVEKVSLPDWTKLNYFGKNRV